MSDDSDSPIPQILTVIPEVNCYAIPPLKPGATGHRSGEWLVASKLFTGRLKVVGVGSRCDIELIDPNTDQLFAACPVAHGMRTTCVQSCVDSSRNFVIRLEDAETRRHAFVGLGFASREEAYDFTEALLRHEKVTERELAASKMAGQQGQQPQGTATAAPMSSGNLKKAANDEFQALYQPRQERSMGLTQTIHVNLPGKKHDGLGARTSSGNISPGTPPKLAPPPPPAAVPHSHISSSSPSISPVSPPVSTIPPPQPPSAPAPVFDPFAELAAPTQAAPPAAQFTPVQPPVQLQAQQQQHAAGGDTGWATFV